VHDQAVERAAAGQRVAVSLPRVAPSELPRGTALVQPGAYAATHRIDLDLQELDLVPARVTAHHGSAETLARFRRRNGVAELRLAAPLVAAVGDHVLLRTHTTVGAGVVLPRAERVAPAEPPIVRPPPQRDDGTVRLPGGLVIGRAQLDRAREIVVAECEREGTITLARARDLLGTSRRTAQALLERLDNEHVTLRIGDVRRLRIRRN
jgi:selenocysteine-specific elongation factor